MRRAAACFVVLVAALTVTVLLVSEPVLARSRPDGVPMAGLPGDPPHPLLTRAPLPGELTDDGLVGSRLPALTDTIDFGSYEVRPDGKKYAVLGGVWTWDHGAEDPLEGWTSVDLTTNDREYWRQMTEAIWSAEGNPAPWPAMNASAGILLCGSSRAHADSLGWVAGIGYGNRWCQRLRSPLLTYDGTGDVILRFDYFNETEASYDYSKVFLEVGASETLLNGPGFSGVIGVGSSGVITPVIWGRFVQQGVFQSQGQPRDFRVRLEVRSDDGLSDEDGAEGWDARYGAIGIDNLELLGNLVGGDLAYAFDDGLQGWTASRCPGAGSFLAARPLSGYSIQDPCGSRLSGNVLAMHDESYEHPGDPDEMPQHELAYSCIVDRRSDIGDPLYRDYNRVMAEWDLYVDLPYEHGVFVRPGWSYYPFENPNVPGVITWSPRIGRSTYDYFGGVPRTLHLRDIGTDWGLPPDCQQVKLIFEVYASCAAFGVHPSQCSGLSNFTPIFDNVVVRNVGVPDVPAVSFEDGSTFQDCFGADRIGNLSLNDPGNADVSSDTRMGDETAPARLGDSLVVKGPVPGPATAWEARLWLRLRRAGPGQPANPLYSNWKNSFLAAKGIAFTPPQSLFTWGYMDSVEIGGRALPNRFCSQFRDGPSPGGGNLPADPMFSWGAGTGEQDEGNEIIPDLALTPGTKVECFATSNWVCAPGSYFYLPDTTGGFFEEFEVLPSFRLDSGVPKFPCVLYVDAFNRGAQPLIERALNVVLSGAGPSDPIPDPTRWDRYDYRAAPANWKASFYREWYGAAGNSGATVLQLGAYRAILVNTGTFDAGCMLWRDWEGLRSWLTSPIGDFNILPQLLVANGASIGEIIDKVNPGFLTQLLGAQRRCDAYFDDGCPPDETVNDDNFCVRIEPVAGTPFGPGVPTDVFGNWCPLRHAFGVLGTTGTGVGNKDYVRVDGDPTSYAQVIHDRSGTPYNYRSCVDAFSYHLLTARDLDNPGPDSECPQDSSSRVAAILAEIHNFLRWGFSLPPGPPPLDFGLCQPGETHDVPWDDTESASVSRLLPNRPNPFNPRTTIRFSLAKDGHATLMVYDATGRTVRTLVDGLQKAGLREVVWDGTNDAGRVLPSGVYWCRLKAQGFVSNRRLIILK